MTRDEEGSEQSKRFCTACGRPLQEETRFCTNCGAPAGDSEADAQKSALPADAVADDSERVDEGEAKRTAQAAPTAQTPAEATSVALASDSTQAPSSGSEPLKKLNAAPAPVPPLNFSVGGSARAKKSKMKAILISAAAIVVVAVAATAIFLALNARAGRGGGGAGDIPAGSSGSSKNTKKDGDGSDRLIPADDLEGIDISGVELPHSYTTTFGEKNSNDYPAFTFSYPEGWDISGHRVDSFMERVELSNETAATIYFNHAESLPDGLLDKAPKLTITKITDAAFTPGTVKGKSYKDLGKFIVARVEVDKSGLDDEPTAKPTYVFLALIPEKALKDTDAVNAELLSPSFDYGDTVAFYCYYSDGAYTKQQQQQLVAILASLKVSDAPERPAAKTSDYLLPDSDKRYLTEAELDELSTEDLFLARNEIYARHGREFKDDMLTSFFKQKSWYHPTVGADDFDASVLNDFEHKNLDAIRKIELNRGSSHVDR